MLPLLFFMLKVVESSMAARSKRPGSDFAVKPKAIKT
jgi:hypothetical protein